jgi:tetratricopeptide (TPR) repeat protein
VIGFRRPSTWVPAALLTAPAAAAYANSLANPFVFDDSGAIVDNQSIRAFATAFRGGPMQSATAGRPIANLSLWINHAIGGLSPAGYHLWNLLVHLLCALLLFGIVRRTLERRQAAATVASAPRPAPRRGQRRDVTSTVPAPTTSTWVAFACALLWLVHPLQTELVDYVTQRTESMMGLAYLLTLYAAIRGWTAVAILACAAGMMTKESMVTAPVMVVLYDLVFEGGTLRRAIQERWRRYAGLAATWTILFAMIASGPRWRSAGFSSGVSAWTYLLNQPPMIVDYLRRTLWPTGLVLDYGLPRQVTIAEIGPAAVVVALLLAATLAAWFRRRELAYLGIWFFVTLAPTSSVVPIATEVGAERRMYLPLAAVIIVIVLGVRAAVNRLAARPQQARPIAVGLLAVTAGGLIALTVNRNQEYSTGARIWQTVVDRRPNGRARYNLGLALKEEGRRAEALALYQQAVADTPDAHYALGFELDADGDRRGAIEHYREYIRLKPLDVNVIRAYNLLGRALGAEGQIDDAAAAFAEVLRMQPRNGDAVGALADIALRQQRYDEAIGRYGDYIRLAPQNPAARFNLGLALAGAHRMDEAAAAFAEAVRLDPREAAFRVNLAEALLALGRLPEAATHYGAAVQLQPDDQELFARMSQVVEAASEQKKGASPRARPR